MYGRASALQAGLRPTDCYAYNAAGMTEGVSYHVDSYNPDWTRKNPSPVVDPVRGTASL